MDNYNNIINHEYNEMVYGANLQQQHPMTSIPREMQINQNSTLQQIPVPSQPSDIINLSYNQRDIQLPHPDLPQQMGLYPTVSIPPQIQQHNHILQQQQQQTTQEIDSTEQHEISQTVNTMSYEMDNVEVPVGMNVQNNQESVENNLGETSQLATANNDEVITQNDQSINEGDEAEVKDEQSNENQSVEEDTKKKEPDVDPNQCRVCKVTESLIDIFAIEEDMRICDIIMKMCNNIRIHERDSLPHMICIGCLGRLRIAYQFMKDVETTDKDLRSKLKRSTKARKTNEKSFVIIDCNEFSESDDDEQNDDEDYQASNAEEEDLTSSGDDTDTRERKRAKRQPKKRGPKKTKIKKIKKDLTQTAKRLKRDIVFIEANDSSDEKNKKREKCKDCNKTFSSKSNLKMHRKNAHAPKEDEAPFKCHVCGRGFKYSINLTSHMQIHKDSYTCDECGRVFGTKTDVKKHALNLHKCSLSYECNKCRRLYCNVRRYQKHRENCSDHAASSAKKKMHKVKEEVSSTGRDLFKTVAPVTTTYWSDSFSD